MEKFTTKEILAELVERGGIVINVVSDAEKNFINNMLKRAKTVVLLDLKFEE